MINLNNNQEDKIFERLQLLTGQRLYSSDIQDIETLNREMRWHHNRYLHQSGIGDGFAVKGEIGDREIKIKPGYAIDSLGREIVLTKTKILPVPPVAGDENNQSLFYDLTVSYPDEENLEETETRLGICYSRGTVRLQEEPDFCWVKLDSVTKEASGKPGDEIRAGLKIRIMRAEIQNCRLIQNISISQRQNARPFKEINIVSGVYYPNPNNIEWQLWPTDASFTRKLGLKIIIDTSSAQFGIPPEYRTDVVGERYVDSLIDEKLINSDRTPYILEGFSSLSILEQDNKQSLNSFILYLLMPKMSSMDGHIINPDNFFKDTYSDLDRQLILSKLGWYIKWMGIEI